MEQLYNIKNEKSSRSEIRLYFIMVVKYYYLGRQYQYVFKPHIDNFSEFEISKFPFSSAAP